jgi:hypothetical protein
MREKLEVDICPQKKSLSLIRIAWNGNDFAKDYPKSLSPSMFVGCRLSFLL